MTNKIDTAQFNEEILKGKGLAVVDFYATWCGPCKMLSPILEQLAQEMPEVKFVAVDIDEEFNLAAKHGIMSVPTIEIYRDGERMEQIIGLQPKDRIKSKLEYYQN